MTIKEFGKGLMTTLIVILAIAAFIGLMSLCHVHAIWIPFLGLTVWTSFGMQFELKETTKIWLSIAIGIIPGVCMGYMETVPAASAGLLIVLFLLMFCMATGKLSYLFNVYTAFGTLVSTAVPNLTVGVFYDCLFGYLLLGVLPPVIMQFVKKKQSTDGKSEEALQ